jgi:hypothetical protein
MAKRAPGGIPRARHMRVVLDDDNAARRPRGIGWLVAVGAVVAIVVYVLGWIAGRFFSHR